MAIHAIEEGSLLQPAPQSSQATTFPAPTGGMDARKNLSQSDMTTCLYAYNIIPSEYGMRVRNGYLQHAVGFETTDGAGRGVTTIIPYRGESGDTSTQKLFVATNEGLWDATDATDSPPLVQPFNLTAEPGSGYGSFTHYTTDAGRQLLFYADSGDGLYRYDGEIDTWERPTDITGVDVADIVQVVPHKQRLWFVEKGSSTAYYLPVGAIAGELVPFYFGSKFRRGGDVAGLFSWSVDGGDGLDDYLVSVSRAGDVIPYRGEDPASQWTTVGTYYIGEVPLGTKFGSADGGDLQLLSIYGVTSMSDLLKGTLVQDISAQSLTYKIAPLIRQDMKQLIAFYGWELQSLESEGLIIINMPERLTSQHIQYVFNRTTGGWCIYRDVPMMGVDEFNGVTYFGDDQSRVLRMDAPRDNIIPDVDDGLDIEFSILFPYTDMKQPALYKRGEMSRPVFIATNKPTICSKILYDYDIEEIILCDTSPVTLSGPRWDIAEWDMAVWTNSGLDTHTHIHGSFGLGRALSVAVRGRAADRTILASVDIMWRTGGFL